MKRFLTAMMQRFKNYGFWLSLFSLIPIICQMCGYKLPFEDYNTFVNALLTFLVAAGIVSNPTTQTRWYGDDPH